MNDQILFFTFSFKCHQDFIRSFYFLSVTTKTPLAYFPPPARSPLPPPPCKSNSCLDSHSNERSNFVFVILILTWKICFRSFAIIRHMWNSTIETGLSATSLSCTPIEASVIFPATWVPFLVIYRALSFTWPASKPIYWNKRKHLDKNRV